VCGVVDTSRGKYWYPPQIRHPSIRTSPSVKTLFCGTRISLPVYHVNKPLYEDFLSDKTLKLWQKGRSYDSYLRGSVLYMYKYKLLLFQSFPTFEVETFVRM